MALSLRVVSWVPVIVLYISAVLLTYRQFKFLDFVTTDFIKNMIDFVKLL